MNDTTPPLDQNPPAATQQNVNFVDQPKVKLDFFFSSRLSSIKFLTIFLFIAILIAIYVGINSTGNSTSIANWQKYENKNMKISFDYPPTWTVQEIRQNYITLQPQDSLQNQTISISMIDNPKNLSLKDLNESLTSPSGKNPGLYSKSNKEVELKSGIKAYLGTCSITGREDLQCNQYIMPRNKKVVVLTNVSQQSSSQQLTIFDDLISTIKSTD